MSTWLLAAPPNPYEADMRFSIRPHATPRFRTALQAESLLDPHGDRHTHVHLRCDGEVFELRFEHPIRAATLFDVLRCSIGPEGMRASSLDRRVELRDGTVVRREQVDFASPALPLPADAYPEVALPFLLCFQPRDGLRRAMYAWINDRFVARVQYEYLGATRVDTPLTGPVEADEIVMYPDFNDWVKLGSVLSRLAMPFAPKYRMWFSRGPRTEVIRYEGPYGPPGAPEIVLERLP